MRDLAVLFLHLLTTVARLAGPGGARAVVAESVLVKQQLLILNRSVKRSPTSASLIESSPACARCSSAELSTRTFCTFRASSRHFRRQWRPRENDADPEHGSARLLGRPRDPLFRGRRLQTRGPRDPVVGRRSGRPGHAAASTDGQVAHDADRLASPRVRRAAAARAVRSVGTASPVPKYISSGVCPRNAECGRTRLCSST